MWLATLRVGQGLEEDQLASAHIKDYEVLLVLSNFEGIGLKNIRTVDTVNTGSSSAKLLWQLVTILHYRNNGPNLDKFSIIKCL